MSAAGRIAELEATVEDLQAEVEYLRAELGLALDAERRSKVRLALGLSPGQTSLLMALHARRGRALTILQLDERIPQVIGRADRRASHVRVLVYQVRQRLGASVIETIGDAYRASVLGVDLVDQALLGAPGAATEEDLAA